jgi:hypothetical protein
MGVHPREGIEVVIYRLGLEASIISADSEVLPLMPFNVPH